nr:hypothetical protein [Tanacetum cinerariifolium]
MKHLEKYRSFYETSSSSSPPTLPIRKRYQGTSQLVEDTKDESLDSGIEREGSKEKEEAVLEGQQQAVSVMITAMDEPLRLECEGAERISAFKQPTLVTWVDPEDGRVYTEILTYVPPAAPVQTSPSPEWSSVSLLVSPSPPVVSSPIALPVTILAATISVDEDQFLEDYDRYLRELYTRSGAVRDEIFSQRYRFRSLEREQERATVTFSAIWRPILALKAWAGHTNAQRAAM